MVEAEKDVKRLKMVRIEEGVQRRLKAEASAAGMSLQDYLAFKLSKDANEKGGYKGVF